MVSRTFLGARGLFGGGLILGAVVGTAAVGCSGDNVKETVAAARASFEESVDELTAPGIAGYVQLDLGTTVQSRQAFAQLVVIGDGRPNMLLIASQRSGAEESYPSVYLHGTTSASTIAELSGQAIGLAVYVQSMPGGPVWHASEALVPLSITSVTKSKLEGTLAGVTLTEAASGETRQTTIKILAEWE